MGNKTKYWTGLSELDQTAEFKESYENEFPKTQEVDEFLNEGKLSEASTGRRDFLKFMGFSVAAASLAACETPVYKAIPFVNAPTDQTPGVANYYASTYYNGQDYASILVKTREGRPIFIKGNKEFGMAKGATNARINASILGLYDSARLSGPKKDGKDISWTTADSEISTALKSNSGQKVILSSSIASPSTQRAINVLADATGAKHVQYDAISYGAIRTANEKDFGKAVIPTYHFNKAKTIVSLDADFMGSWLMSNIYHAEYAQMRKPEGEWMSKHYQVEAVMSMSGTNADTRMAVKPTQVGLVAAALYSEVAKKAGKTAPSVTVDGIDANRIKQMANDLWATKGASLVVAGQNNTDIQAVTNAINSLLGNYGNTIDIDSPVHLYNGDNKAVDQLVADMGKGSVGTLIVYGCNPAYSLPNADAFVAGLAKVKTSISTALVADETASKCMYMCPDQHFLESWNDINAVGDRVDMVQPTIAPVYNSRQAQESFLKWSGSNEPYYNFLRKTYDSSYTDLAMTTDSGWNVALHNGTMQKAAPTVVPVSDSAVADGNTETEAATPVSGANLGASVSALQAAAQKGSDWEVSFYQKVGIGDGAQSANPWLQELPDPVTKVTWDNYFTVSPADVEEMGLNIYISERQPASVATLTVNGKTLTLPVVPQPGQKRNTVGVALGYGRGANGENIGRAAFQTDDNGEHLVENDRPVTIGKNVAPYLSVAGGNVSYSATGAQFAKAEGEYKIATTQTHHTVMGRDSVVKETTYDIYEANKTKERGSAPFNKFITLAIHQDGATKDVQAIEQTLWHEHPVEQVGHRWGMSIDLSSCTGCSACVTSCHIENNVPVVGKDEVLRSRDMHWLRIDRYYSSDMTMERWKEDGIGKIERNAAMEIPSENPQTVHMPMMCQHCNHAPCETVCPVAATTHSNEGLNQMTYNRCIGTRYCANNCPYKVRRFNWWNYQEYKKFDKSNPAQDNTMRMVLNPDVTVRSRGVMEKCSLCVQRIQTGKLEAKVAGTPVIDGSIETACAEACPTNAITFGDLNDGKSSVKANADNVRSYNALEEVGVKPNMYYMTKVRNNEA